MVFDMIKKGLIFAYRHLGIERVNFLFVKWRYILLFQTTGNENVGDSNLLCVQTVIYN